MRGTRPRLTTTQKGYGAEHQALRAKLAPLVEAGQSFCHEPVCVEPTRWIRPGTEWHLSHTPDGSSWRGPSHRTCNLAEARRRQAALAEARKRSGAQRAFRRSQEW
jgi:hypothetical protein